MKDTNVTRRTGEVTELATHSNDHIIRKTSDEHLSIPELHHDDIDAEASRIQVIYGYSVEAV